MTGIIRGKTIDDKLNKIPSNYKPNYPFFGSKSLDKKFENLNFEYKVLIKVSRVFKQMNKITCL